MADGSCCHYCRKYKCICPPAGEAKPSDAQLREENECLAENLARVQKHLQAVVAERDGLNERVRVLEEFARYVEREMATPHLPSEVRAHAREALAAAAPQLKGEDDERAEALLDAHQQLLDEEHYRLMAESHGEP